MSNKSGGKPEKKEDDFDLLLDKVKKHQEEISQQLETIHRKLGFEEKEIERYLDNRSNFTAIEWEIVQKKRQELQEELWSFIGKERKKNLTRKEEDKTQKKRKGKTVGVRKKWMPM